MCCEYVGTPYVQTKHQGKNKRENFDTQTVRRTPLKPLKLADCYRDCLEHEKVNATFILGVFIPLACQEGKVPSTEREGASC